MVIDFVVSPYPSLLENMVAKIYETTNPIAEVASFTLLEKDNTGTPTPGAGHQVKQDVTFNGLDTIVHIIRIFTASATLLMEWEYQPKIDTVTIFDDIYFKVGDGGTDTPAADQPTVSNMLFAGKTAEDLTIIQEGLGPLIPETDYVLSGIDLSLTGGVVFETDQRWRITRKPEIITDYVNDSVVAKGFGGFIDVVADVDYNPSHLRKLIRLSGTGDYTFPAIVQVPIGYNHIFTNMGANPSSPKINFLNGTLLYGSTPKDFLIMPFGSTCHFTWDGTNWNLFVFQTMQSQPVLSGDIIYKGTYNLGDIGPTAQDQLITITHGQNITFPYTAYCTVKSFSTDYTKDNAIAYATREYTNNSFKVGLRDIVFGRFNNIKIDYVIIKD